MRRDMYADVQVTGVRATAPRLALTGQTDPLIVADPWRDPHGQRPCPGADAFAGAFRAHFVDDRAAAAAIPARLGERERALTPADQPGPATGRAGVRNRARLRAASTAS